MNDQRVQSKRIQESQIQRRDNRLETKKVKEHKLRRRRQPKENKLSDKKEQKSNSFSKYKSFTLLNTVWQHILMEIKDRGSSDEGPNQVL